MYLPHLFQFTDGHLGCFHFLAIMNSAAIAAMNMGMDVALQDPAFSSSGNIPQSGTARPHGNSETEQDSVCGPCPSVPCPLPGFCLWKTLVEK